MDVQINENICYATFLYNNIPLLNIYMYGTCKHTVTCSTVYTSKYIATCLQW